LKLPKFQLHPYIIAVLSVGLALIVKLILDNWIGQDTPFLLFFSAVIISAYYGGRKSGLLAAALAALIAYVLFLTPSDLLLKLNLGNLIRLGVFLLEALAIISITTALHTSRRKAEITEISLQVSEEQVRVIEKQSEAELYQREQEFKALVENSPDIIARFDQELRHLYVNPAVEKATGKAVAKFIGKTHQELGISPEKWQRWQENISYVFNSGEELTGSFEFVTPEGTKVYHSRLVPEFASNGAIASVLSVARDMTQQKQTEEALRNALQQLTFHVENSPLAIIEWDSNFRISRWSSAAERIFGWKSEEIIGKHPEEWTFVFPDDQEIVQITIQQLQENSGHRNISCNRNYTKNGSIVECEWYNSALLDESGKLVSVLSLVLDVTERQAALRDRQQAEAAAIKAADRTTRLQAVTASLSAALTPLQVADVIVEQAVSALGACRGVMTLLTDCQTELEIVRSIGYPPEVLASWQQFPLTASVPLATAVRTQEAIFLESVEEKIIDQGELSSRALAAIPLALKTGVLGALGLGFSQPRQFSQEDCEFMLALGRLCAQAIQRAQLYNSEQKARAAAEANEQRFRFLAESIPQIVWTAQANGDTDYFNQRWFDYTGITLAQSQTIGADAFRHPDDQQRCVEQWIKASTNKEIFQVEQRLRKVDGTYRWHLTRALPMLNEQGEVIKWFGTCTDIDDGKRAEEALRKTNERLKLLSETANNLLLSEQPEEFIDSLFKKLSVHLGLEIYLNYLVNQDQQSLHLHAYGGIDPERTQKIERLKLGQAICGGVALNQQPRVIENVQTLTDDSTEFIRSLGITAYVCYPLVARDQQMGTLSFGTRNRSGFDQDDLALMQVVCDQVATTLERTRLITQLQQQAEDLASSNRMKDEFLAVLSHELRTPLNSMLGWAKLLRTRKFDQTTTNRALETIERNAVSQSQLIEDILDVSRIIQGKLRLRLSPVNLMVPIEAAIDTVRSAADAKGIQIQSQLVSTSLVSGDVDRLQQVVWNLVSNAIKFTPPAGQVEVKLQQVDTDVVLQVSDTGKGISSDFLPYVFDRFRQADASITRSHGGLGLGLAIVRHLVELHGGTIQATSQGEGKGATFTVKLPLLIKEPAEKPSNPEIGSNADTTPSQPLAGLQVLVVDDEADSRDLVIVVLEESGAKVTAVASAAEAIAAIRQSLPQVLISDIGMPDEDGYSLMSQVREWVKDSQAVPKAIALTAYASEEDRKQAFLAGFQMHLPKPLDPTELVECVVKLIGGQSNPA
jgi:PAS domain S-box-containing protein